MKIIKLNTHENINLYINVWDNIKQPIGCVLIIHDIKEDAKKYSKFAEFLESKGFVVWISDLRNHGKALKENNEITHHDYFKEIVGDYYLYTKMIDERYEVPIAIVGQGFGAHVAHRLIEVTDISTTVILSGMPHPQSQNMISNRIVANSLKNIIKLKDKDIKFEKFYSKRYEKYFEDNNYINDIDGYYDKYTTENILPIKFYTSWFNNIVTKDKNFSNINPKTKILITRGELDVTTNEKQTEKIKNMYLQNGIKASSIVFENKKHNIYDYDDINVYNDILDLIKSSLLSK